MSKSVLVTGSGSGLGLATARSLASRGFVVYGSVRSDEGLNALNLAREELISKKIPHDLRALRFDVTDLALSQDVLDVLGQIDVLINNAGINEEVPPPADRPAPGVFDMDLGVLDRVMEVNTIAPWRLMTYVIPGMKKRDYGRIVNVTSLRASMGQWSGDIPMPTYRLSKNMLNAITQMAARELQGTNVLINAVCPGWCQTKMGGPLAPDSIDSGVEKIIRIATLPDGGPNGDFFINNQKALY